MTLAPDTGIFNKADNFPDMSILDKSGSIPLSPQPESNTDRAKIAEKRAFNTQFFFISISSYFYLKKIKEIKNFYTLFFG